MSSTGRVNDSNLVRFHPLHRIAATRGWIAAAGGRKAPLSQASRRNSAPFFGVEQIEFSPPVVPLDCDEA